MSKFKRVLSDDDIEELYLRSDMYGGEIYFSTLVEEIEQAVLAKVTDIQELRKDAERYRWLRDGGNDDIGVVTGFDCVDVGSTGVAGTYREGLEGEQLDKAIDSAMEKQE